MPPSWLPKPLEDEAQSSLLSAALTPLRSGIDAAYSGYQQAATTAQRAVQSVASLSLPHPSELFGQPAETPSASRADQASPEPSSAQLPAPLAAPSGTPQPAAAMGLRSLLPDPSTLFGQPEPEPAPAEAAPRAPSASTLTRAIMPPGPAGAATAAGAAVGTAAARTVAPRGGAPEQLGAIEEGTPDGFFRTAGPYARQVERETGVPAQLSLAIAANETGYGQRRYMAGSNNFHGIQAVAGEPGAVPYKDWRPGPGGQQQFYDAAQRSFDSPLSGFRGFAQFLTQNPRYAPALERYRQTQDVNQLAADVHAAGYAEDPSYTQKITSIMRGIPVSTGVGEVTAPAGVSPTSAQPRPLGPQAPPAGQQGPSAGLDVSGIAQAYKGVPYVFGGAGGRSDLRLGAATDCSGFASVVYKTQFGIDLPAHTDTSYTQLRNLGAAEVSDADARPGDVVYYMGAGTGGVITHHMGISAGPGKVLDMSVSGGDGVRVRDVGHAGTHVILRDPRINAAAPARQEPPPPPIVPTGIAERTGGPPPTQAQVNALSRSERPLAEAAAAAPDAVAAQVPPPVSSPWSPDAPLLPRGASQAPTGRAGGGVMSSVLGFRQPLVAPGDVATGSSYNDPTAGGTLDQSLRSSSDIETMPGRFSPIRTIEPLGPALRGVTVGPAYMRPGTRNQAVPGQVDEWTEPADLGEGLYPSGSQRNSAVMSEDSLTEQTPAQIQAAEADRYTRGLYEGLPRNPGLGYEGAALPGTIDPSEYPWSSRDQGRPPDAEGAVNQQLSYRQPLGPTMGPDTATGAEQPTISGYNDPTAGGPWRGANIAPSADDTTSISQALPALAATPTTPTTPGLMEQAGSALKPVWDAAGNVVGAIHTGLGLGEAPSTVTSVSGWEAGRPQGVPAEPAPEPLAPPPTRPTSVSGWAQQGPISMTPAERIGGLIQAGTEAAPYAGPMASGAAIAATYGASFIPGTPGYEADVAARRRAGEATAAGLDRAQRQAALDASGDIAAAAQARQDEITRQNEMAESATRADQRYGPLQRAADAVGGLAIPGTGGQRVAVPGQTGLAPGPLYAPGTGRTVAQVTGLGSAAPEGAAQSDVGRLYEAERNLAVSPITDIEGEGQLGLESAADRQFMEAAARQYGRFQDMPPEVQAQYLAAHDRMAAVLAQGGSYAAERAPGTQTIRGAADIAAGLASIPLMPGLGEVAGVLRTGTAAERAAMAARLVGGVAVDPTGALIQTGLEGPVLAAEGARRGLGALGRAGPALEAGGHRALDAIEAGAGRVRGALAANAENVAAADARMAEGGTQRPGTLGVITDNPLEASRATRAGIVPPEVADQLGFPIRIPDDPSVLRAIEAAGGSVDPERGVTMNVIRMSDPEAAGGVATRGAPFYTAGPPGSRSPYAREARAGPGDVGGQQRIEGQTRFRSPLIISDAPGEAAGFDDAMRQMTDSRLTAAQQAFDQATADWEAAMRSGAPNLKEVTDTAFARRQQAYDRVAEARAAAPPVPTAAVVEHGIREAKRAGPAGSSERAQALKDLVSRYGGDPNLIDDLIALRGADMGESVYAVKENIVAHNARAKGYDGVITVQPRSPAPKEIAAHPAVKAAETERFEINRRIGQIVDDIDARAAESPGLSGEALHQDPRVAPLIDEYNRLYQRLDQMPQALEDAKTQAYRELSSGRITELMDPREARNPTPAPPDEIQTRVTTEFQQKFADAYAEWERVAAQVYTPGHTPTPEETARLVEIANRREEAARVLKAIEGTVSRNPPGYALREDVPRAPGTRASTIVENPRYADVDQAYTAAAERSKAAQAAATAAEDAHQATPNAANWRAYRAAQDELTAARAAWSDARTALDAELERGRYVTAPPDAVLPTLAPEDRAAAPTTGLLSALGRTASQEALNAAGGAFASNVVSGDVFPGPDDQRTPGERARDAMLHAGVGAAGAVGLRHGGSALARRLGGADLTDGGFRIGLGDVPPSKVNQQVLPSMHPLQQPPPPPIGQVAQQFQVAGLTPGQNAAIQRTLTAAQQRAQSMAARGLTPPSAWDWIKAAGYSGIYSPATLVSSAIGGAQELALAQPKEAIRALVQGRPGAYGQQVRAQAGALGEGLANLGRVLVGDASGSAAVSGGSRGTAGVSERVVNPAGHFAARTLERPGEILTEAPDAVFRPLFRAQGMAREARQVASEMDLRGPNASAYAEQLLQDAQAVRTGQVPTLPATQRVLDAGEKHADDLGYKGQPGGLGQYLSKLSKRNDAVGVAASFLMPFPSMASRMTSAAIKSTPGSALIPGIRRMYPSKFDMVYDQAFGTAVASGVAYWAMNGGITGSGPTDPEERAALVAQGWQPSSTLVDGHYMPNRMFQRFQPFLDTAGEIHDTLAYGKPDRSAPQLAAELVKRGSKIATDQVGLSGLADLHDMLESGFSSQFPGWAARSMVRYLPYGGVLRSAAASLDPVQRRADRWQEGSPLPAIGEQLKVALPGLRQTVPAVQDPLGRPLANPQQGLGAFIPRTTTLRDDPLIRLFQDANVDIGKAHDQMTVGRVSGVSLKPPEQRRWNELRGQFVQDYADAYTSNADFMALPSAQKEKYLKAFLAKAGDYADRMIQSEMDANELTTRVTDQAMKKAAGQ